MIMLFVMQKMKSTNIAILEIFHVKESSSLIHIENCEAKNQETDC